MVAQCKGWTPRGRSRIAAGQLRTLMAMVYGAQKQTSMQSFGKP